MESYFCYLKELEYFLSHMVHIFFTYGRKISIVSLFLSNVTFKCHVMDNLYPFVCQIVFPL